MHFFIDRGMNNVGNFYNLDEMALKHMLIPPQARGTILRFIKFMKKKLIKRRKANIVNSGPPKLASPRPFMKKPKMLVT